VASATVPAIGIAADWKIRPTLQVRETYTDNVRLAPQGLEQSDWITEIDPGLNIQAQGARLQLKADYAFQYRLYNRNSDSNGHNHRLNSSGLMDIWDRKFFVQAGASITQQNLSPLSQQSTGNVNLTNNRVEVRQSSVSPYWVSRLGSWGNLQARYTWSRAETDNQTQNLDSDSQTVNLGVTSGPAFSDLGWSLTYNKQRTESTAGQLQRRDLESLTGTARYKLSPIVFGLVTIGREDNSYGSTRGSTSGEFYSVGLEWAPSSRTRVRGTIGERYYGNSYSFDAEHRTRLTSWTIGYSEQITVTPGQFSVPSNASTASTLDRLFLNQFPDAVERQQAVDALIAQERLPTSLATSVDFLSNQVSLSKRLSGAFGIRGVRSTVLISVFRDNRTSENSGTTLLGTDPFLMSNSIIQTGYSAILSWRFTERTAGSVSLGQNRVKIVDTGGEDNTTNFRVGLTHQLQPKVLGAVDFKSAERDATAAGSNFRENAITGSLSLAF